MLGFVSLEFRLFFRAEEMASQHNRQSEIIIGQDNVDNAFEIWVAWSACFTYVFGNNQGGFL